MPSFFEKLKKGMNIEKAASVEKVEEPIKENEPKEEVFSASEETEEKEASEEKIPQIPLGPEEISPEELEKKIEEDNLEDNGVSNASVKSFLSKVVKETDEKPKKQKKSSIKAETAKVKKSVSVKEDNKNPSFAETSKSKAKWFETEGQLVVDIYQTDDELVVQSAIAGINPDDLDISIENDMVVIKGKREKTIEKKERNYFYSECHWGYFSREIILPVEVDASKAEAGMKNGILTIRMPKIEKEKKKISVK